MLGHILVPPVRVSAGLPVVVGTAPINQVDESNVNKPVLAYQPVEKRDLRRCASFLLNATYRKYALFLEIRAPCISSFLNRL
ncbi:MAG: hypothetical protein ACLFOY_19165 [Desulfatibacillaceae bacterium]